MKRSSPLYPTQQTSLYDCRRRDASAAAAEQPKRGCGNISIHDRLMEPFVWYLFEGFVGLDSIHALHLHMQWVESDYNDTQATLEY